MLARLINYEHFERQVLALGFTSKGTILDLEIMQNHEIA